jgi:hypothetical protein
VNFLEEHLELGVADRGVVGGNGFRERDGEGLLAVVEFRCWQAEGRAVRAAGALGERPSDLFIQLADTEDRPASACLRRSHASRSSGRWPRMRSAVALPRSGLRSGAQASDSDEAPPSTSTSATSSTALRAAAVTIAEIVEAGPTNGTASWSSSSEIRTAAPN